MTKRKMILKTDVKSLYLKSLVEEDAVSIFTLVQINKVHLTQHGDYQDLIERDIQTTRLEITNTGVNEESFGIFLQDRLLGIATLIKYGTTIYGLGYWIGEEFQGNGYMTEAVSSLINFACNTHCATEIWAGIKHANSSSIALVTRLGFELKREQESHISFQLCPTANQISDE